MASEKQPEKHNARLDRKIASNLWRHTLSKISSVTGRLFLLASLRNQNSGKYEHHGLEQMFGSLEATRALKKSHREAFKEWMSYDVEEQTTDLVLYLSEQPEDRRTILKTWEKLEPYRNILPSSVNDVEKKHYLADLRAILKVLRNAAGAGHPDLES
jgi:hypothetical protein